MLVKTSNPGGKMFQDLPVSSDGRPLYRHVAEYVEGQAAATAGPCGYGAVGAVVGATVLTVLKHWLQDLLPRLIHSSGNYETIVFGMLMVLLLQRARSGLMPLIARVLPIDRKVQVPAALADAAGSAVTPLAQRVRPAAGESLLEVREVVKRFGGLIAVNRVSFEMQTGEILGLIGPNGAGKSTMFNLITGVLEPSSGQVWLRGERIDRLASRRIAERGIARTFQHVQIRPLMSVIETWRSVRICVAAGQWLALHCDWIAKPNVPCWPRRSANSSVSGWATRCSTRRAACHWVRNACWKWRGRCVPTRCCCCSMSRQRDCAIRKSARWLTCCADCAMKACRCCWSNTIWTLS